MSHLALLDSARGVPGASAGHVGRTPRTVPAIAGAIAWTVSRRGASWTRTALVPAVTGLGVPRPAGRGGPVVPCGAGTGAIRVFTRPRDACLGSGPRPIAPSARPSSSVVPGTAPLPVAA